MNKLFVDRIEENFLVCEDENKKRVTLLSSDVLGDVKEGSVLVFSNGHYEVSESETIKRREEILKLQESLWE